ncbi:MAG: GIY-YIG nuclease family protein [Elusimicrobiota bacterium]|jgi:hypothetical protein|nr:GIY-YIG nuclease family protein [Elusimicrobiota bacterium]
MQKQDRKKLTTDYKNREMLGGVCAIKNNINGKVWIEGVKDIVGRRNRFEFVKNTGSAVPLNIRKDWELYGAEAFSFEVLEELKKGETQTDAEFAVDIETLKDIFIEKFKPEQLY